MSKLIRISLGVDPNHNLTDFPVNIYTGSTSGDTTNWGFTETPVLTFPMVTSSPFEFYIDDELLQFGLRLESGGCNNQDILVDSPRVDCDMCGNFEEYNPPQPTSTPNPTQGPTQTPLPPPTATNQATPQPTGTPTSTPEGTAFPTPNPTANPTSTPNATPEPTPNPTLGGTYYRIQSCNNALDFHAPKNIYCGPGGILTPLSNTFIVGDVVQFIDSNAGCGTATYCGIVIDDNFVANPNSQTAYISRVAPVGGCEDELHCVQ